MKPTKAVIMRPTMGGPDEVHVWFGGLPSPTSTTKNGFWMTFKAVSGTGDRYCRQVLGIGDIEIRE